MIVFLLVLMLPLFGFAESTEPFDTNPTAEIAELQATKKELYSKLRKYNLKLNVRAEQIDETDFSARIDSLGISFGTGFVFAALAGGSFYALGSRNCSAGLPELRKERLAAIRSGSFMIGSFGGMIGTLLGMPITFVFIDNAEEGLEPFRHELELYQDKVFEYGSEIRRLEDKIERLQNL